MNLLRAGTVSVADLGASRSLYERYFDYRTVEEGIIEPPLANAWGTPKSAGCPYAVLQPASGAEIYLRLVEAPPVGAFVPLVTYGWSALEFCVRDLRAIAGRFRDSPFRVLGKPRPVDGLEGIQAMQIQGPDGEVCYLTQIEADPPGFVLPRAQSPIDHLFINVLAASDMDASQRWMVRHLGLRVGRGRMDIVYTLLANAFGISPTRTFAISTMVHESNVFLEVDQLPGEATRRPRHAGHLPPGIAVTTLRTPRIEDDDPSLIAAPTVPPGKVYDGRRSATRAGPDGTLFEVLETV